jgi:hypothetical protein
MGALQNVAYQYIAANQILELSNIILAIDGFY